MVDIITKTSANEAMIKQEEMEEEFEDGELVEEGEICDDDDDDAPEQKPGRQCTFLPLGILLFHSPSISSRPSFVVSL